MSKLKPTPIAGSTVVVTGAGSGIGRALAQRFSAYGCPMAIVDADEQTLAETEALMSTATLARPLDVRDRQGQLAFAAEVAEWAPAPIAAVFNNAGVAVAASVANTPPEDHDWLMSINFEGVVHGTRAFLPLLLRQNSGAIVNTSSVFGLVGIPFQSAYCASKFAVRGFTEALRHELSDTGVRAITVHPGGVRTNIARRARVYEDPLGEDRTPEQVVSDFEAILRTTPEKAAKIIHRGLDAGKARILVGPDAYLFDALARLAPTHYYQLLARFEGLARGAAGRRG